MTWFLNQRRPRARQAAVIDNNPLHCPTRSRFPRSADWRSVSGLVMILFRANVWAMLTHRPAGTGAVAAAVTARPQSLRRAGRRGPEPAAADPAGGASAHHQMRLRCRARAARGPHRRQRAAAVPAPGGARPAPASCAAGIGDGDGIGWRGRGIATAAAPGQLGPRSEPAARLGASSRCLVVGKLVRAWIQRLKRIQRFPSAGATGPEEGRASGCSLA